MEVTDMGVLEGLKPERVFYWFERISEIPRGSGDMDKILSLIHISEPTRH